MWFTKTHRLEFGIVSFFQRESSLWILPSHALVLRYFPNCGVLIEQNVVTLLDGEAEILPLESCVNVVFLNYDVGSLCRLLGKNSPELTCETELSVRGWSRGSQTDCVTHSRAFFPPVCGVWADHFRSRFRKRVCTLPPNASTVSSRSGALRLNTHTHTHWADSEIGLFCHTNNGHPSLQSWLGFCY